jgi:hypothetical protein
MQEVLRILSAEQWAQLQPEREQREELLTAVGVMAGAVLLGVGPSKVRSR